ncbi:MAG: hypothetical protein RL227_2464 [Pseudomonadota bacterium]
MSHPATARNPFLLMISPEVVLAAVEKSERLGQLNRHLCRPLDRPTPPTSVRPALFDDELADDDDDEPGAA